MLNPAPVNLGLLIFAVSLALPTAVWGSTTVTSFQRTFINLQSARYLLVESSQAQSDIQCAQVAGRIASIQLFAFKNGLCKLYSCAAGSGNSCLAKCRDISLSGDPAWARSSHVTSCWVTVQHRVSGSVDFYRNWSDYKVGFGEGENANFWIGLDALRSLALSSSHTLRLEVTLWSSLVYWAELTQFSIGPESGNYTISWEAFSGTLGDSMRIHLGNQFSTWDRNNCKCSDSSNCAVSYKGAWWFGCCHNAHLNGQYYNYSTAVFSSLNANGIVWLDPFGFAYSMKEAEMLVA